MTEQFNASAPPLLEMRSITKYYGQNRVLDRVNFTLERGEIHALLGENGAGKTTLMNILRGITGPTDGQILIDGEPKAIKSPLVSSALGIGMVNQHFLLIPAFTVEENLILAGQKTGITLDRNAIRTQAETISNKLGWKIPFDARVADLTVGIQQRIEILKALLGDSRIVLFDEPTAVLTPNEVDDLLEVLRALRDEGRSLVFVSHKLSEVMAVCDRVTVLRRGKLAGEVPVSETNPSDLARRMVGDENAELLTSEFAPSSSIGQVKLRLHTVTAPRTNKDDVSLEELTFDIGSGEILGIAGVDGNGQEELFEVLSGTRPYTSGTIDICDLRLSGFTSKDLARLRISLIPPDRQRQGLALNLSIRDNLLLDQFQSPTYKKFGLISNRQLDKHAENLKVEFDVRTPDISLPASSLSGGNQQKIVIARALSRRPNVVVAASPTRGLDVAATAYVHRKLRECRDDGAAIVLISTELDEVITLSNRIAIIYEGRITAIVPPTTPRSTLGLYMGGKQVIE